MKARAWYQYVFVAVVTAVITAAWLRPDLYRGSALPLPYLQSVVATIAWIAGGFLLRDILITDRRALRRAALMALVGLAVSIILLAADSGLIGQGQSGREPEGFRAPIFAGAVINAILAAGAIIGRRGHKGEVPWYYSWYLSIAHALGATLPIALVYGLVPGLASMTIGTGVFIGVFDDLVADAISLIRCAWSP